ncbi:general substrate transporter [Lipomyces doorenjongii]
MDPIEDKYGGVFIWLLTCSAAVGGLLFGYDLIVISGILVMVKDDLGETLTSNKQELLTSIASGGAFIGALIAGVLLDRVGRKIVIGLGALVFTVGSIIQATSFSLAQLTVGRFVVGLGIGEAAMVAPIYIAEISPAKIRGRLVTVDSLAITGGECIANALNIAFEHVSHGWRYSVGLAAVPSLLLLGFCFVIPETPRYLIHKNRIDEARAVTSRIYPHATEEDVLRKVNSIREQFAHEEALRELSIRDQLRLLYSDKPNLRALIVACGLMGIQQFAGANAFFYYGPTLFALAGFNNAIAVSIVLTGTNFLFTIFALKYLDTVGRRKFMVWTVWPLPICLSIAAIAIHYIPIDADLTVEDVRLTWAGIVVLVCVILFIATNALALGNVPWQGNELFPMEVRSLGTMMLTLTCWGSNIVVSSTYLSMMKKFTPTGAFGFYAGLTFVGWIAIVLCYPEVSGLTLEEIKDVFRHGFGVRYSVRMQKDRKLAVKEKKVLRHELSS